MGNPKPIPSYLTSPAILIFSAITFHRAPANGNGILVTCIFQQNLTVKIRIRAEIHGSIHLACQKVSRFQNLALLQKIVRNFVHLEWYLALLV